MDSWRKSTLNPSGTDGSISSEIDASKLKTMSTTIYQ